MNLKKSYILGFVLILFCSIAMTACDGIEYIPEAEVKVAQEQASAGGTLVISSVEPKELNPLTVNSMSFLDVSKLLFEQMAEYDSSFKLSPVLAKNWGFQDETAQFTITLKDDIYWSDNEKITSSDVIFSYDTIKNSQNSAYKDKLEHVYSYKAVDNNTIKVVFDQQFANATDILTIPIIPEHIFRTNAQGIPVSSGAYKIAEYTKVKQLNLVPNEKWIRLGSVKDKGTKPYIDIISVQFINDVDAFSSAFEAKELDILHTQSYDWEKYSEMKDVKTYKYTSLYYDFIGFNYNNTIFQDKAVRKAIMSAINRKGIVDKYLLGNAVLTDVPINPDSWLYDGKEVDSLYSKTNAQNLLSQAGFTDSNNDKVLERKFDNAVQTLSFTLITNTENEFRQKAAAEIEKNLEAVGFQVQVVVMSFEEMRTAIASKQFDAVLTGYNLSPNQDLSFAFHSSQIASGKNFMSYNYITMDNYLYQAYTCTEDEQRKYIYEKLQDTFRAEVPCVSLFFRESAIVVRDKVKGQITPDAVNPYRNIQNWFIAKDRR